MKERCAQCGATYPMEDGYLMDDTHLCPSCWEGTTTTCNHCGERIWCSDNMGTTDVPLCRSCYDNHYATCDDCGAIIHTTDCCYASDDSDIPYCARCVGDHATTDDYIQSYYFHPSPLFYGEGSRFLGVELEIDEGGECNSVAQRLLATANQEDEYLYIKRDGSLDSGMELVTHPLTLAYHREHFPWEALVQTAKSEGYYSHRAETCGLHVHVNRSSLGESAQTQDVTIARILYFVENHWNELLRFSRRTERQLRKWAARYGRKDSPKEVLDNAKCNGAGRYTCVNLTNHATIEFRIFRGTLKFNTIIATLELVEELCNLAVNYSDEQMQGLTWTEFVTNLDCEQYPELIQYLKERRLYVNEPVDVAVEP